jgi:LPS-assembly lipoprotein
MFIKNRLAPLVVLTVLLLSACGFQLRGSDGKANLPFKTIFVGVPENSPLGTELKRNLRGSGATTIVTDRQAADAIVDITADSRDKAILSLNSQGRVREYTLYYRVTFRVTDVPGKELLGPTQIVLKRDISFNEAQVIAKEKEEEILYRDMQSDAVQQILRRMAAIQPS